MPMVNGIFHDSGLISPFDCESLIAGIWVTSVASATTSSHRVSRLQTHPKSWLTELGAAFWNPCYMLSSKHIFEIFRVNPFPPPWRAVTLTLTPPYAFIILLL